MKFEIDKGEKRSGGRKRYRMEVTLTGVMGLGTVLVLGLVWVFIFGVLVGRGYQPEETLPELAKIMPEDMQDAGQQGVIKPEDLRFHDTLRQSGDTVRPEAAEQNVGPSAEQAPALASVEPQQRAMQPAPQPVQQQTPPVATGAQSPAPAATVVQPQAAPAPAAPQLAAAPEPAPSRIDAQGPVSVSSKEQKAAVAIGGQSADVEEDQDQTVYDYIYQVASLSKPESALKFRDQVRSLGLQSEVKVVKGDNKYWHRVVVMFQGRPIDTREMKAKLKSLGVDKPLLRSKEPHSGQASQQSSQVVSSR